MNKFKQLTESQVLINSKAKNLVDALKIESKRLKVQKCEHLQAELEERFGDSLTAS